jgi:hypothetical protein
LRVQVAHQAAKHLWNHVFSTEGEGCGDRGCRWNIEFSEAPASKFRSQFRHRHLWRRQRIFQSLGLDRRGRSPPPVDICFEAGVNLFDTADVYSDGLSEEILGKALEGKRDKALISTKATFRMGDGPNDVGSSRYHLTPSLEASLRRLGTDYVDIYHLHGFDALTPIEETLDTLNKFVREGKVRYIACSNFSGWHLMKSLAVAERYGWTRYVAHQVYYSLIGRDYEWELMPLASTRRSARWSGVRWAGDASPARSAAASRCPN